MTGVAMLAAILLAVTPWAARRRASTSEPASRSATATVPGSSPAPSLSPPAPPSASAAGGEADPALLLDLVAVALAAGAPVPAALAVVGSSWPGAAGEVLVDAARALALGAPWGVAWTGARGAARAVATALEPAWATGASPVPLLRTTADRLRSHRRAETRAAAGRLGVQLVVPLGLCYLPAFVLVGLVPVVVSLASGLLR